MENLTKERAHDLCVEMWNEIAENNYNDKYDCGLVETYEPSSQCFACEYYERVQKYCDACPFSEYNDDTGEVDSYCLYGLSPYRKWIDAKSAEEAKQHAIAIADLFI